MPSARVPQRSRPSTSLLIALAIVGCATASSGKLQTTTGPEQRFSMTGSGIQTSAVITPDGAQGPSVNLGRFDNGAAIRGTLLNQPFQLAVDQAAGSATGQAGQGPITVNVAEEGDQLKCTGLILGRPSTLTASRDRIQGTVGFCAYDLTRSGDAYLGSRSCGGGISSVTVRFPSSILEWKPINICVLMAILMSTP